jgi:3-deoxy-manno-octulosonate cytidylyltransferase (CMP-KDO synthetase)
VIPARYASTRFPGKLLARIDDIPLVMWPYRTAVDADVFDEVIVAADDARIVEAVRACGGNAVMSAAHHECGTERVAEVAAHADADYVVNIQGDEPAIPVALLRRFVDTLSRDSDADSILTCVCRASLSRKNDPDVVKAVLNSEHEALYFSRAPIPYCRDGVQGDTYMHTGIYGFSSAGLQRFVSLPRGRLEACESLEQLRALEHGMRIRCMVEPYDGFGIDTPEDLDAFIAHRSTLVSTTNGE